MSTDNGIVSIASSLGVDATVEKLKKILQVGGAKLFALVDHSGEAEKAGLQMRNTKLLIFGNPKGGTPLMVAAPTVALDLPLKILVWEDADARVWITYNSADYILHRHNVPGNLKPNIAVIDKIVAKSQS
jgi:uncharacterized protein (DUF302 family)